MEMNMKEAKQVRIVIYDLLGREVRIIHDGVMPVGTNTVNYELRQSGTYMYNIFVDAEKYTGKLIVN